MTFDLRRPRMISLDDDDEESRALAELAGVSQGTSPDFAPQPSQLSAPMLQGYTPPSPVQPESENAMLERKYAALRNQQLDTALNGNDYDFGKFARDVAPAFLAGGLNLALNKGKQLPEILAVTAQGAGQNAAQDAQRTNAARQFSMQARQQELTAQQRALGGGSGWNADRMALEQERIDARKRELDLRDKGLTNTQGRFDTTREDRNDPESARNRTTVQVAGETAAARAHEGTRERLETQNELAGTQADTARQIAAGRASGALPYQTQLKQTPGYGAEQNLKLKTEAETRAEETQNATLARQYSEDTQFQREQASALDGIDEILGRYKPGDIPGVGGMTGMARSISPGLADWGQSLLSDSGNPQDVQRIADSRTINSQREVMNEARLRSLTGAAGPETEALRTQVVSGSRPNATEAEFRTGLAAMRTLVQNDLMARSAGREGAARNVLSAGGLQKYAGMIGQGRSVPPISAAGAGGGARMRTITDPQDGSTEQSMLTDEQAAQLTQEGYQVQ